MSISQALRLRVKDMQSTQYGLTDYIPKVGTRVNDLPNGSQRTGWRHTMQDVNHPNYAKRRKAGEIIMGDMVLQKEYVSGSQWNLHVGKSGDTTQQYYHGDYAIMQRLYAPRPAACPFNRIDMPNRALIDAYAKMNASPVMSSEIILDLGKTLSMLRRPFREMGALAVKMVKKRDSYSRKTANQMATAASNAWLEYRYGWTPFLMDAQTSVEESLLIHQRARKRREVARASCISDYAKSRTEKDVEMWSGGYKFTGHTTLRDKLACHAGVIYGLEAEERLESVFSMFGMRARDIVPSMWELTPYSFVVDWFVNIGPYLQAASAVPGTRILGSWVTSVHDKEFTSSGSMSYSLTGAPYYSAPFGDYIEKSVIVTRDCDPEFPHGPVLKREYLSLLHLGDALALVAQPILVKLQNFSRR